MSAEYYISLDEIYELRNSHNVKVDKVIYLNTLRKLVGERLPKNKAGVAIVTDYDLINADPHEHFEALTAATAKCL